MHFITVALFLLSARAVTVDYRSIKTAKGDVLPDFSFCGYRQSDHKLPSSKPHNASAVVPPSASESDDRTGAIQDALDQVAKAGGGVVELAAGAHYLSGEPISIPAKTWIRGAASNDTVVYVKGKPRVVFTIGQSGVKAKTGKSTTIEDSYVGIGAGQVTVKDASLFAVGDSVYVQRAATAEWIRANGMADLVRHNKSQTWIKPGTLIKQPRTIALISGNKLTLDIPLTDQIDKKYGQGSVQTYTAPDQVSEAGIESMQIILTPSCSGKSITDTDCQFNAVTFQSFVTDSWARALNITGFGAGFVTVQPDAKRITLDSLVMNRDEPSDGSAGYGADIGLDGTQVLVQDCVSTGVDKVTAFSVVTSSQTAGPNAVVNQRSVGTADPIEPHMRWAHGLLIDNSQSSIQLLNRGTDGTGHGWTINAGVAWNSDASYTIQQPPLGVNWGIGMRGKAGKNTNGTLLHTGEHVVPASLFTAQLQARRNGTSC